MNGIHTYCLLKIYLPGEGGGGGFHLVALFPQTSFLLFAPEHFSSRNLLFDSFLLLHEELRQEVQCPVMPNKCHKVSKHPLKLLKNHSLIHFLIHH